MKFEISSTATIAATMARTFTASFDMGAAVWSAASKATSLRLAAALQRRLRGKAVAVAEDRHHCRRVPTPAIAQGRVAGGDVAVDVDLVPRRGMADIADSDVVMLAP